MRKQWWMLAVLAACSGTDPVSYVARDPCAALAIDATAATAAERAGIDDAVALWRSRGVTAFDLAAPDPQLAIRFDDAAATFHGVYDPAHDRVVINRAIADRATLAIVIAHELGHVFGLTHVAPAIRVSLMNADNLATPPTDADQRALEALWGVCH